MQLNPAVPVTKVRTLRSVVTLVHRGASFAHAAAERLRRAGDSGGRHRRLQPYLVHGELEDARNRSAAGAGREPAADRGAGFEAEPHAGGAGLGAGHRGSGGGDAADGTVPV